MNAANIQRLEIARRVIMGESRADLAAELDLRPSQVRGMAMNGIQLCKLYADPPVTNHVTISEARAEQERFINAIDLAIMGSYLRG